jgi:hypothetical protein
VGQIHHTRDHQGFYWLAIALVILFGISGIFPR